MESFVQLENHGNELATSVREPADFLHHLASQVEILACLRWLGEFQVLACIPVLERVPIKDVADLSGVPEGQLLRVIHLTATAGFLHEPQPGQVTHSALSAPFVTNPSYLDAAMFLATSATPAALDMALTSQRFGESDRPDETAYNVALKTSKPFHTARQQCTKLHRQWSAYLHYSGGLLAAEQWVLVGAASTSSARSLTASYPTLRFLVQISDQTGTTSSLPEPDLGPRITVAHRTRGSRQTVTDAAVYILHLPRASALSPTAPSRTSAILRELQVHLSVLHASRGVMLILTARLLPNPGSIADPAIEAQARSRDLILRQLTNQGEIELEELLEMIDTVRDSVGKLAVTSKLRSCNGLVVALVVEYQMDAECHL
ncbi:MAG: hypothetical protein OHK93_004515 [Ramalina farinacea]|uniref:Uncharacterized protein n=1 Tax=Ramalina farinacea TaxID=258253 RepID=A0AA43QU98_9LECA|nr:hypothetical protein [Ramalina farinacea]